MNRRILALAVLLIAPALALVGWYVYEQLPTWQIPAWMQPGNPDAVRGSCEALATMRVHGATFASGETHASAEEARAAANYVVSQQYDLPPGSYVDPRGPALVRGTFSGRGPGLAWLNIAVLDDPKTDADTRLGKVAIIYTDAQASLLLETVTGVGVDDPLTACGGGPVSRREIVRKYLPLIVLAAYGALVGLSALALRLMRRRRK